MRKRLLVFYGVYEAERSFAAATLAGLLDVLSDHDVTVDIQDDASPSHLGRTLARQFSKRARVRSSRLERSLGYHGMAERVVSFFHRTAASGESYDYVLRVDADLHFASRRLGALIASKRMPDRGLVGHLFSMRKRDYALWLADLTPAGLRRHVRKDGLMEHHWELRRTRPVWWSDIGRSALRRGFRGRMAAGGFQILSWPTLMELHDRGWLRRDRRSTGFIFQDDVLTTTMVQALGHPIVDLGEVDDEWKADLGLFPGTPIDELRSLDLLHPLKDNAWAHEVRASLPLS